MRRRTAGCLPSLHISFRSSTDFPVSFSVTPSGPNASLHWAVEKPPPVLKTVPLNDHIKWLFTPLAPPLPLLSTLMSVSFLINSWELQKVLFHTTSKGQTYPKTTCYHRPGPLDSGQQRFFLQIFHCLVTQFKTVKSQELALENTSCRRTMRTQVRT